MNLDDVKIAAGFDLMLFRGMASWLFEKDPGAGGIPKFFEVDYNGVAIFISLASLNVDVMDLNGELVPALYIEGNFVIGNSSEIEFDAQVEVNPIVQQGEDEAVAAFEAGAVLINNTGLDENIVNDISAEAAQFINEQLAKIEIPIFDGLIEELEAAFFPQIGDEFPNGEPPSRDQWATHFYFGQPHTLKHVEVGFPLEQPDQPQIESETQLPTTYAFVATVALPDEDPTLPEPLSIVPEHTGIQILIAESAMNALLANEAIAAQESDDINIQSLNLQMHTLGVQTNGEANKFQVSINWDGLLTLPFRERMMQTENGSVQLNEGLVDVVTSGIDVNVPIPWWVVLFPTLPASITYLLVKAEAPDTVRSELKQKVAKGFNEVLDSTISQLSGLADIPLMAFAQDAWVLDKHYTISLVAFAGINSTTITEVQHDTFQVKGASGQSVGQLRLGTGHVLHPKEAGQLLKEGILRIPGYHGVNGPYGYYVRSNPNGDPNDNLVDPELIFTD
ncbi:MAG: DUF3892 domain-containing protein [Cyanobacteria bacterium P01_G01_bin.54]